MAEFEASALWYSDRSATAARRFCVAIDNALASISLEPDRFALVDDRHRACSVAEFPFQIVFRCSQNLIFVVAIAHAKRRPGYWRDR
ncbi:MAG: hypothetical protein KDA59_23285 [Planctomycetales bacterium]|nr:hypothetical protein [Planctomycetales bacterium]